MRKILLYCTLLLLTQTCFGQGDSLHVSNKWCSKADTPLLFLSANNLIVITGKNSKLADLSIKSLDYNNLKISAPEIKNDTLSMLAMPYCDGVKKKMRLAISDKKTKKVLRTINFYADSVPKPVARIGDIKIAAPSRKDVLKQSILKVAFPNSLYNYPYKIKQYTFKIKNEKLETKATFSGGIFPSVLHQYIADAPEGSFFEFTDIKATCPDCATRLLENLKIKVQ